MLTIRGEQPADYDAIDHVNRTAFGQEIEPRLVRDLRAQPEFDPELSLVAEEAGRIVGHILFTPLRIEGDGITHTVQTLAPLAVVPQRQRQGVGTQLTWAGLEACRRKGHVVVVVVGHPWYYPRFGFEPARTHGLEAPFPVPDEAFMVRELVAGALARVRGMIRLSPPFDTVMQAEAATPE
ncbi:MAG TPA: N-acetyltransferase [Phycisphaerae bacterium]|nr:N-acetyltransferase [Phycisphaerae bacterium]HNU45946.1 N-acetyltransferase [Phycisphaerae bacterium]